MPLPYLSPDAKVLVGVEYRQRRPLGLHSLTLVVGLNRENVERVGRPRLEQELREVVISPALADEEIRPDRPTPNLLLSLFARKTIAPFIFG